jgi:hypothetical protein
MFSRGLEMRRIGDQSLGLLDIFAAKISNAHLRDRVSRGFGKVGEETEAGKAVELEKQGMGDWLWMHWRRQCVIWMKRR